MALVCRALSAAERRDWLRLIRTENVGPITFFRLLERYGTAEAALRALPELALRGGRTKPLKVTSAADATREMDGLAKLGGRMIAACEPEYPAPLRAIDDPPPLLSVLGHLHVWKRPMVGVVGARNASLNGRRLASQLARGLGAAGYTVSSGLARGIDTAAHEGSLATGTVAVMAGGVDAVYPDENRRLYDQIVEIGAVIAESPLTVQPQARHFPRRNRLVSGLALGVVVVEAALRSGSLITARTALEQGREVFAVPGAPGDPRSQGANQLLRDGAHLVETAADITEVLARMRPLVGEPLIGMALDGVPSAPPASPEADVTHARTYLETSLSPTSIHVDELIRDCHLAPSVVLTALLELELAGRVERQPGNRVCLIA